SRLSPWSRKVTPMRPGVPVAKCWKTMMDMREDRRIGFRVSGVGYRVEAGKGERTRGMLFNTSYRRAPFIIHVASQGFDGVGEDVDEGFELFGAAAGGAGEGEDERRVGGTRDAAGEEGAGGLGKAAQAGELHEAGVGTVDDAHGGFRGVVARGEARAAGGDDEVDVPERVGPLAEARFELDGVVGEAGGGDDLCAQALAEHGGEGRAGDVDCLGARTPVGDGEDSGADGAHGDHAPALDSAAR